MTNEIKEEVDVTNESETAVEETVVAEKKSKTKKVSEAPKDELVKCKVMSTIQGEGKKKFFPGEIITLPIEQAMYLNENKIVIIIKENN